MTSAFDQNVSRFQPKTRQQVSWGTRSGDTAVTDTTAQPNQDLVTDGQAQHTGDTDTVEQPPETPVQETVQDTLASTVHDGKREHDAPAVEIEATYVHADNQEETVRESDTDTEAIPETHLFNESIDPHPVDDGIHTLKDSSVIDDGYALEQHNAEVPADTAVIPENTVPMFHTEAEPPDRPAESDGTQTIREIPKPSPSGHAAGSGRSSAADSLPDSADTLLHLMDQLNAAVVDIYTKKPDVQEPLRYPDTPPAYVKKTMPDIMEQNREEEKYGSLKRRILEIRQEQRADTIAQSPASGRGAQAPNRSQKQPASPDQQKQSLARLKKRLQEAATATEPATSDTPPWSIAEKTRAIIESFREKYRAVVQERDTLAESVTVLRSELENARQQTEMKTKECEQAEALAHERITLVQETMAAMECVVAERDQALLHLTQVRSRDEMLSGLLEQADAALEYKDQQIRKLREQEKGLYKTIETKDNEIEQLNIHLSQMTAQRDQLRHRLLSFEKEMETLLESHKALAEVKRMMGDAQL